MNYFYAFEVTALKNVKETNAWGKLGLWWKLISWALKREMDTNVSLIVLFAAYLMSQPHFLQSYTLQWKNVILPGFVLVLFIWYSALTLETSISVHVRLKHGWVKA